MSAFGWLRDSPLVRATMAATLAPAAATGLALVVQPGRALGAVSIFLLGVVVAAAIGGLWAGLAASLLGFFSLNYFFTEPLHTFRVNDSEDVVALVVFLVVAVIVGSLLARILDERARATRGERESRLLNYFATKVLSGEPLDRVLGDFAGALLGPLRLARCRISVRAGEVAYEVERSRKGAAEGETTTISLQAGGEAFGTLSAVRAAGQPALAGEDQRLLDAAAAQVAVALERARLDAQIVDVRVDAESNQARAALFWDVTRDIQTPLATIKTGITQVLASDAGLDEAQRRELLQTVLMETEGLERLLSNLLDLARFEAGGSAPSREPIAVDGLVDAVLQRLRGSLSAIRVRTIYRDAPKVAADPDQLAQVVTILLDNAARYSPVGGDVVVSVAPWKTSVQVRVSDQGPGIPKEERERVFEASSGGADGRSRGGLGLAIARAIVEANGGRIRVEGSPSGGASVVFELPAIEGATETSPGTPSIARRSPVDPSAPTEDPST